MARKKYQLNISLINSVPNYWLTNFDPNNVQAGGGSLNIGNNSNQPLVSEPLIPVSPTQFNVTLTPADISQLPPNTQWQAITYPFTILSISPQGNNLVGRVTSPGIRVEDEWSASSRAGEDEKKSKTKKKISKATAS